MKNPKGFTVSSVYLSGTVSATLAFLMTMQATGQPWAVLANEGDEGTAEPVISENESAEAADGIAAQTAEETADDPVIEETSEEPAAVAEDSEPAEEVQQVPETPNLDTEEVSFNDMSVIGNAPAEAYLEDGTRLIEITELPMGVIANHVKDIQIEGTHFEKAVVGNKTIAEIRYNEQDQHYYYRVDNSEDTFALDFENGERFHLIYSLDEREETKDEKGADETRPVTQEENEDKNEQYFVYFEYYTEGYAQPTVDWKSVASGTNTFELKNKDGFKLYATDDGVTPKGEPLDGIYVAEISGETTLKFIYVGDEVEYTVRHIYEDGETVEKIQRGKVGALAEPEILETSDYKVLAYSDTVIEKNNTVVTLRYRKIASTVSFDSKGGTFQDPFKISPSETVSLFSYRPTKAGYDFVGWTTKDGDKTSVVTALKNIDENITLYALWNAKDVEYTIRVWKQSNTDAWNASEADKSFVYYAIDTGTAKADSEVKLADYQAPKGFRVNKDRTQTQTTVKADGTTEVDIYLDRVVCTAIFEYEDGSRVERKGLYEQAFPAEWWDTSKNFWYNENSRKGAVLLATFDFETASYSHTGGDNENWTTTFTSNGKVSELNSNPIQYFVEQWDGSYKLIQETIRSNSNMGVYQKHDGYILKQAMYSSSRNFLTSVDLTNLSNWQEITEGEGKWKYPVVNITDLNDKGGTSVNARYVAIRSDLSTHKIIYRSGNKNVKTIENVKYTTPLTKVEVPGQNDLNDFTLTERPDGYGDYYTFEGWYTDPAFKKKFDPTDQDLMPNGDFILYAKWEPASFGITLHTDPVDAPEQIIDLGKFPGGSKIGSIEIEDKALGELDAYVPVKEGYTFAGWYLDPEYKYQYSGDKILGEGMKANDSLSIYAKWIADNEAKLTINFLDQETNEPVRESITKDAYIGDEFTVKAEDVDGFILIGNQFETKKIVRNGNVINFYYLSNAPRYYKIQYVDVDTHEVVVENPSIRVSGKPIFNVVADMSQEELKNYILESDPVVTKKFEELGTKEQDAAIVEFRVSRKKLELNIDATQESSTFVYDGDEHSIPEAEVHGEGGEAVLRYSYDDGKTWVDNAPKQTDKGKIDVMVKAVDLSGKYKDSDPVSAFVKVVPRPITVEAVSRTWDYDGLSHEATTGIVKGAVEGQEIVVLTKGTVRNVADGEVENVVTDIVFTETAKESNYIVVDQKAGILQINPVSITVRSQTVEKDYDGTPLKNGNKPLIITGGVNGKDGFAEGEGIEIIEFTGSRTEVGTSKNGNTFTYTAKEGTDLEGNYILTTEYGDLIVHESEAVIIPEAKGAELDANGVEKLYDGKSVTIGGQLKVGDTVVADSGLEYSIEPLNGSEKVDDPVFTNAGEWRVTISSNNKNVTVEPVTVTVKINKRNVVLVSENYSATYNGKEHKASGVTVQNGCDGFAPGEGFSADTSTVLKDVDVKENEFNYSLNEGTLPGNYQITKVNGSIEVTPRKITVSSQNVEKYYDGTELTNGNKELIYKGEFLKVKASRASNSPVREQKLELAKKAIPSRIQPKREPILKGTINSRQSMAI